jgi:hypothetical protein
MIYNFGFKVITKLCFYVALYNMFLQFGKFGLSPRPLRVKDLRLHVLCSFLYGTYFSNSTTWGSFTSHIVIKHCKKIPMPMVVQGKVLNNDLSHSRLDDKWTDIHPKECASSVWRICLNTSASLQTSDWAHHVEIGMFRDCMKSKVEPTVQKLHMIKYIKRAILHSACMICAPGYEDCVTVYSCLAYSWHPHFLVTSSRHNKSLAESEKSSTISRSSNSLRRTLLVKLCTQVTNDHATFMQGLRISW